MKNQKNTLTQNTYEYEIWPEKITNVQTQYEI